MKQMEATERIQKMRRYYLEESPMSVHRELAPWKCHRNLLNYYRGWELSRAAPTARMRRSMAEAYMLAQIKPVILPGELLVGQPDFSPLTEEEEIELNKRREIAKNVIEMKGRADHLALDYPRLLKLGVRGMLADICERLASLDPGSGEDTAKYEFYECCRIELEALLGLSERYAARARELAEAASGDQRREYEELAEVLTQVPAGSARTLREALQSIRMFVWSLFGIYSFGKPDYYLLPYYRADIEAGRLTPESAQELIDSFFLLSVPNMSAWAAESLMLGGRDPKGNTIDNELTRHFLIAIAHTHIPDPNVGFCVTPETDEQTLRLVASLILDGHCQPQIWNSDEVTRSMLKYGFAEDAARMFTISTCVEITPIGLSGISITSPYINLPKIFLDALFAVSDDASYDELFSTFRSTFRRYAEEAIRTENLYQLERARNGTDPMRISPLIGDCLDVGCSNDAGGARYNILEPDILGMQNVSESFNIISRIVYEERRVTLAELKAALSANYEGYEELLLYIRHKTKHFGTGDGRANEIARSVADAVLEVFSEMSTVRGAKVIPGAFSYRDHEIQGRTTPATPDGRRSGDPLNDGSCPVQGYDDQGPTASLASTVSWSPSRFLGGTSVNVKLHPDISPDRLLALIRGYCEMGGTQLQFNIVSTDTLRDAQANPERYGDLLVRIGGYSDFFVRLPSGLQNEIISRSENH